MWFHGLILLNRGGRLRPRSRGGYANSGGATLADDATRAGSSAAGATPPPPPPPPTASIHSELATASVDPGTLVDQLPCVFTLGLLGSEPKVQPDRVFFRKKTVFSEVDSVQESFRCYELVTRVAPSGGGLLTVIQATVKIAAVIEGAGGDFSRPEYAVCSQDLPLRIVWCHWPFLWAFSRRRQVVFWSSMDKVLTSVGAGGQNAPLAPKPSALITAAQPAVPEEDPLLSRLASLLSQPAPLEAGDI